MELKQISDHIYYTECDPRYDRPVLGYILGAECAVMVDAGNSASHAEAFTQAVQDRGFPLPMYCVITHWHWDHTFGMHALHAETVAHVNTNWELRRLSAWSWDDKSMQKRLAEGTEIEFADQHIRAEYHCLGDIRVSTAMLTFSDQLTIHCGGLTCRCIHLPSAHSNDSVVIHVPEEGILFLGDIYNDDFYHGHARDLDKTKQLRDALSQVDFHTAVAGHSRPVPKGDVLRFLDQCLSR